MKIAVHITHESVEKLGGIGAVINGVSLTKAFQKFFDKNVIYGPLFELPRNAIAKIENGGKVLFSSYDKYDTNKYSEVFADIINKYNIDIIYGERKLICELDESKQTTAEVLLIGIHNTNPHQVAVFKYILWEKFGIQSNLYEGNWDNEQYLRIAIPFLDILDKLYDSEAQCYLFAHEYMGIPCALAAVAKKKKHKTIFVAHEVTTARFLVEGHPGHDISFYNILKNDQNKKSLEEEFGSQKLNPRNELIKRAVFLDRIFTVGDLVKDEYMFLVPDTPAEKIKIVYNGLFFSTISAEEKKESRNRIKKYSNTLLNFTPDIIFTHVARLVISKGIWRDISLLFYLDEIFASKRLKGIYIFLATLIVTGRAPEDILRMEKEYGWPVLHKEGWPDLVGTEIEIYKWLQIFNSKSKAIKAIFLNQYGFSRERCGMRVPEDVEFRDFRIASDAEFGFSIYEPFGIAHIEVIPFGGISLISSVCGSSFLLQKVFQDAEIKPFYIVDFLHSKRKMTNEELKALTREKRDVIEREVLSHHAGKIFELLALTEKKRETYLQNAKRYAPELDWENVVAKHLIPNLSI
jgi:hypothetical protein